MNEFTPGEYETINRVNIRREPRIIEYTDKGRFVTNQVGSLTPGTRRTVYSVITQNDNFTWGRISEADGAGIAQWICLKDTNREFVKRIHAEPEYVPLPEFDFMERLAKLESWARSQGYRG